MTDKSGALLTNQDGAAITTPTGALQQSFGKEIDFFDDPDRGRLAYDGDDRDISDLWVTEAQPFASTGNRVWRMEGYNVDGTAVPHSAASLPRDQADSQYAYLPYYPRRGDRIAWDAWFDEQSNPDRMKCQFHFGVGGDAPEYGSHNLVALDNSRGGVILGRETQERGGYVTYDTIPYEFETGQRYTIVVWWLPSGHFTVYFRSQSTSTKTGDDDPPPYYGRGIGMEVDSTTVAYMDSIQLA